MSTKIQELKNTFEKANQGHVFKYYNQLSAKDQASPESGNEHPIEPLTDSQFDSVLKNNKDQVNKWENTGLEAIAKGEVGIILLAGGQGTRLGSSDPKGCYNIGLPSHKSLFQIQAERIARLQHLSQIRYSRQVNIPWYVMTSKPTSAPTQDFFKKNNFFGLDPKNVIFFNQGTLPCLSKDGKILLEDKSNITMAPDGNGGIYPSLRLTGMLQDMEKRGIKYLHAYCVDNCLVKVCDPIFVGY
ncbi:nucleotide-diphospho-sugar transferase, partial [Conidiobolus coronatus NRRL 28638]